MNNYSWLQQKLHQFALSSQFMRETTFDVEKRIISTNRINDNNVFITGLARSGTTILLNSLYQSNEFASLTYKDMPFVLAPNLWSKLLFNQKDINKVERAHGDGIEVSTESPEAFEEVFWMTFDESDLYIKEKFINYVELINKRYNKERYLSKNNQNIRRLDLISNTFPNSKILITFRNPIQHAYSLLSQHRLFINKSKKDKFISYYMKWIGHTEFGPNYYPIYNKDFYFKNDLDINHWLEQWYEVYKNCYESIKNKENFYFISYEKICSTKEYWTDILQILNIKETKNCRFNESKKDISLQIDDEIKKKAFYLFDELKKLNFK